MGAVVATTLVATSSPHSLASTAPAGSSTACPIVTLPTTTAGLPWLSATYRASFTPDELAQQVLNCEGTLHPSTAVLAELALVGLNYSPNGAFENQTGWLLNGAGDVRAQGDFASLGIPALTLEDGPTGVIYRPPATQLAPTALPTETMVAATMDPALAEQFGQQLGLESSSLHFMGIQAPDLNLDRLPNWGRIPETFGEDPVLAGEMGAAETIGILHDSPIAVLKHFGTYGQEAGRKTTNDVVSSGALYDTYLRPFAIATRAAATSPAVPAGRQVALMCSYGSVNGARSCIAPSLVQARATLAYSGLVRTDLNVETPAPALLAAGVSLIKPLVASDFEPTSRIRPATRALIRQAAQQVLETLFAANLVTKAELATGAHVGKLTSTITQAGDALSTLIEERAAVLLKNGRPGSHGSLPLSKADRTVALIAPFNLNHTCAALASWLSADSGDHVTCSIWNSKLAHATVLMSGPPSASEQHPRTKTVRWRARATGTYLVEDTTYGDSTLSVDGTVLLDAPGLDEDDVESDVSIHAVRGRTYSFTERWGAVGPILSVRPLATDLANAVAAARGATMALVLADDYSGEGFDRNVLSLPSGQDSVISAVAATAPTSVALLTPGPVTMPWLDSVHSVIELWNASGMPPFDLALERYVSAYGALLDGRVSPSGHLPMTFPASSLTSPMELGGGGDEHVYWPGVDGASTLSVSPIAGTVIGYGWYQSAGWPVLFPFGFGLGYSSVTTDFDPAGACAEPDGPDAICLPVTVSLAGADTRGAHAGIQVYVAQPSSTADPRPLLVLGAADSVDCGTTSAPTGACDGTTDADESVGALDVGAWNADAEAYQFLPGCYGFVTADGAGDAYNALADPSAYPGQVVHAEAPFSAATTLAPGACPG
jgi:beta-glucosidase